MPSCDKIISQVNQPTLLHSPEENGGVVASLTIVTPPAESLGIHSEVLANSEDGEGESLEESRLVLLPDLGGAIPVEPLVVVNVARLIVDRKCFEGDVDRVEANVDSQSPHHFLF